jgi:hypothetical protein
MKARTINRKGRHLSAVRTLQLLVAYGVVTSCLDRPNLEGAMLSQRPAGDKEPVMDVADWLRTLGLERYEAAFRE